MVYSLWNSLSCKAERSDFIMVEDSSLVTLFSTSRKSTYSEKVVTILPSIKAQDFILFPAFLTRPVNA